MTAEEEAWWELLACRRFVFGPPADLVALEELLEARRTASPEEWGPTG